MTGSVLITGTSSGIGLACVACFHAAGWRVVATVRKTADADRLRAQFAGLTVLVVDLVDQIAVARVIGDELMRRGGVDVVVNNAGASIIGAAEELSLDDFRAQMAINFFSAVQLVQLALPYMREKAAGRIVQVSSGFGRIALPMFAAYCASKHALEGYSEALAHEVHPFGVRVSLVEPGPVATQFDNNRRDAGNYNLAGPYAALYDAMRRQLAGSHRRASTADDVAAVIFRAATVSRPALRYPVGRTGFAADFTARFVPDALKKIIVGRMLRQGIRE